MKIREYLDSIGIDYDEGGKNTTEGWVEISCPFPGCDDPSKHLGIDTDLGLFNCWVCGETGNLGKLIKYLEDIPWEEANFKAHNFENIREGDVTDLVDAIFNNAYEKVEEGKKLHYEIVPLPEEAKEVQHSEYYPLLWKFLRQRKISNDMVKKYNLHYCRTGYYSHRLIFPIYDASMDLIGFTSRDMTGKAKIKYLHSKGLPLKEYLYGLHLFNGGQMILVEGCIDAMRTGEGAIALFDNAISSTQRIIIQNLYKNKLFNELVIALDDDSYNKAEKVGREMFEIIDKVKVLELPKKKDPADLGRNQLLVIAENTEYLS